MFVSPHDVQGGEKKKENNNQQTRGRSGYKAALSAKGKRRCNQRIPHLSPLMPWPLPWEILL
jgi:hypothetical protein